MLVHAARDILLPPPRGNSRCLTRFCPRHPPPQEFPFKQLKQHRHDVTGSNSVLPIRKGMRLMCGNPKAELNVGDAEPIPALDRKGFQRVNLLDYCQATLRLPDEGTLQRQPVSEEDLKSSWCKNAVYIQLTVEQQELINALNYVRAPPLHYVMR